MCTVPKLWDPFAAIMSRSHHDFPLQILIDVTWDDMPGMIRLISFTPHSTSQTVVFVLKCSSTNHHATRQFQCPAPAANAPERSSFPLSKSIQTVRDRCAGHIGLAPDSTAFKVAEGTSRLPKGLISHSGAHVHIKSTVSHISREGSFWNIQLAGKNYTEKFDMVVLAAPLSRANISFSGLHLSSEGGSGSMDSIRSFDSEESSGEFTVAVSCSLCFWVINFRYTLCNYM